MQYADGSVYDGSWKRDKKHGFGTYTSGSTNARWGDI